VIWHRVDEFIFIGSYIAFSAARSHRTITNNVLLSCNYVLSLRRPLVQLFYASRLSCAESVSYTCEDVSLSVLFLSRLSAVTNICGVLRRLSLPSSCALCDSVLLFITSVVCIVGRHLWSTYCRDETLWGWSLESQ
jgi:hypothetical protein